MTEQIKLKPVVLCGPYGVGKTTIAHYLEKDLPGILIKANTTAKQHRSDYTYISDETFHQHEKKKMFCITYNKLDYHYAIELEKIKKLLTTQYFPICELYTHSVPQFIKSFPHTAAFYLLPDSLEFLEKNMKKQGYTHAEREELLDASLKEIELCNEIMHPFFTEIYVIQEDNHEEIAEYIKKQLTNKKIKM